MQVQLRRAKERILISAFSRQSFRQYDGGQLHRTWGQMHGNNRRQEFDNYERERIRPTTTGMPRDSGRTVALHKKEERRWGTAFRRKRRELSSSLSSYVKTDDDGNDDNDDDRDGAMFPGGAKFFVKMESARQRGWYESRQKTRQRSHTIDSGIGQNYFVSGALSAQIQLVSNEILLWNIRGTVSKRVAGFSRRARRRWILIKKRQSGAIFPWGRLLSFVIRSRVRSASRERLDEGNNQIPNPTDESCRIAWRCRFLK